MTITDVEFPSADFVWLHVKVEASEDWWIGGGYIPGQADNRFRSLQGNGHTDHFQALEEHFLARRGQIWFFGGDLNCITGNLQPHWGGDDLLDVSAPEVALPERVSADARPTNAHGWRLLEAIADSGMILNGVCHKGFAGSFTRLPQRKADCPGVLDYVLAPPRTMDNSPNAALQVLATPADLSDHQLTALAIKLPAIEDIRGHDATCFIESRLKVLKVPQSLDQWRLIIQEIEESRDWQGLVNDLKAFLSQPLPRRCEAQRLVDDALAKLVSLLYNVFKHSRMGLIYLLAPATRHRNTCVNYDTTPREPSEIIARQFDMIFQRKQYKTPSEGGII